MIHVIFIFNIMRWWCLYCVGNYGSIEGPPRFVENLNLQSVCGWVVDKTKTYRDPRHTCRDQLNVALHVKNHELTEYVMCLFGMCVGDIKQVEPRYIESPRDVCWGSGFVALDVTYDVYAFPMVHAVGEWWTKPWHIGIRDTRAGDQLNVALYVKKITS